MHTITRSPVYGYAGLSPSQFTLLPPDAGSGIGRRHKVLSHKHPDPAFSHTTPFISQSAAESLSPEKCKEVSSYDLSNLFAELPPMLCVPA